MREEMRVSEPLITVRIESGEPVFRFELASPCAGPEDQTGQRRKGDNNSEVGCNSKRQAALVLCLLAGLCPCAFGLNPSLQINQYAHKAWTIREGFFKSKVLSIAQTPDGYLWIGTDSGLVRFDGVRIV